MVKIYSSYLKTYGENVYEDYVYLPLDVFYYKIMDVEGIFKDIMSQRYTYIYEPENIPKGKSEQYRKSLNERQMKLLESNNKSSKSKEIDTISENVEQRMNEKLMSKLANKGQK